MMGSDPDVSTASNERVAALAAQMKTIHLDGKHATQYKRTRQTAAPTAAHKNLAVTEYSASAGAALLDSLVHRQRKKFLVVGHSNTIPGLLRSIGLQPGMQDIPETEYEKLFVVKINWFFGRSMTLFEEHYEKRSPRTNLVKPVPPGPYLRQPPVYIL